MLEVPGDLKETAGPSNPTPSFSSWPVKQPNQEEAAEARLGGGGECQAPLEAPEEERLSRQKPMESQGDHGF